MNYVIQEFEESEYISAGESSVEVSEVILRGEKVQKITAAGILVG